MIFVWRCTEPDPFGGNLLCPVENDNGFQPYASSSYEGLTRSGRYFDQQVVMWCPTFWDLPIMEEMLNRHASNQHKQIKMDNFALSTASIMLHETWQFGIVSNPRTLDYAYYADSTYQLARTVGATMAYVNAHLYTLDAVAIYTQQYYRSPTPPMAPVHLTSLGYY
jgi:hypothetical protein